MIVVLGRTQAASSVIYYLLLSVMPNVLKEVDDKAYGRHEIMCSKGDFVLFPNKSLPELTSK